MSLLARAGLLEPWLCRLTPPHSATLAAQYPSSRPTACVGGPPHQGAGAKIESSATTGHRAVVAQLSNPGALRAKRAHRSNGDVL